MEILFLLGFTLMACSAGKVGVSKNYLQYPLLNDTLIITLILVTQITLLEGTTSWPTLTLFGFMIGLQLDPDCSEVKDNQRFADTAAGIHEVTEESIINKFNALFKRNKTEALCLAGGVALNSKVNSWLLRGTPFKKLFIPPPSGGADVL